jgi:hypothetical protein
VNLAAVRAELPQEMRAWCDQHASARSWAVLGMDVALMVATALLGGDRPGEAGITPKVHRLLCRHSSPAVRQLAQSAVFPPKRWRMRPVARAVAQFFDTSFEALYLQLRWRRGREKNGKKYHSPPLEASGIMPTR